MLPSSEKTLLKLSVTVFGVGGGGGGGASGQTEGQCLLTLQRLETTAFAICWFFWSGLATGIEDTSSSYCLQAVVSDCTVHRRPVHLKVHNLIDQAY
ncbi:hypothetical protein TSPI_10311 [Trichinella spiralis]|uniref:Secreted protein n=1 Tax=Trichinella spiralis TaxID=6334 RepID=A0ABR3KM97_TRISP